LFAGCGGSSTGYRLAGGKVLAINEFIAGNNMARKKPKTINKESRCVRISFNLPTIRLSREVIPLLKGHLPARRLFV